MFPRRRSSTNSTATSATRPYPARRGRRAS
jgi:hypothetical protein